ncbi:hypothetical protein [Flindersiella endophytica]
MRTSNLRFCLIAAAVTVSSLLPAGAANAVPEKTAPKPIVHQVPRVPLTINGHSAPASTITRYNGRPLYMAVVPGGSPNGQLMAFTKPADFERFVREHGGPVHATAKPQRVLTPEAVASGDPLMPMKHRESGSGQTNISASSPVSVIYSGDYATFFSLGATAGYGLREPDPDRHGVRRLVRQLE